MVEVDPILLIAGGVSIAILAGSIACLKGSDKSERNENKPSSGKKQKAKPVVEEETSAPKSKQQQKVTVVSKQNTPAPSSSIQEVTQIKAAITPVPEEIETKSKKAKETPEQKAARLERQKIAKSAKKDENKFAKEFSDNQIVIEEKSSSSSVPTIVDDWAVVEDKKKQKVKKVVKSESVPTVTSSNAETTPIVSEQITQQVSVDSKKLGNIIGPKGVTLKALQDETNTTINMPKISERETSSNATILVIGNQEGVTKAAQAINDLATKGYSALLEGDGFQESNFAIHSMYLPDIIGKNGASIRALQDTLGVKVVIPQNVNGTNDKVKIKIAGQRDPIAKAKVILNHIMEFYYHEITHPGVTHVSLDVPERMYSLIIGPKGSEIKHIQNNFKVSVHIPSIDTVNRSVLIVGTPSNVEAAQRYVSKIVQQANVQETSNAETAELWNEQDGIEDEWTKKYTYDRDVKPSGTLSDAIDAQSAAWKVAGAGWNRRK